MGTPKKRLVSVIEAASGSSIHGAKTTTTMADSQLLLTELLDTKQTFVYKKLVVPMNMRSIYWKCYGFPASEEGEILTKSKIVCVLCKTVICYNGNTSNLRMHLRSKHPQELENLEAQAPPKKPRPDIKEKRSVRRQKSSPATVSYMYSADGTVHLDKDVHIVSDPNITLEELNSTQSTVKVLMKSDSPTHLVVEEGPHDGTTAEELELQVQTHESSFDRKTISDAIAEFIIMDLQLPDVVETPGFQRLVATLRSPCEIPSKVKLVEDVIPKLYDSFKESIKENLAAVTSDITIGIEEWVSDNSLTNITITAHYQIPEFENQLQSKILLTHHCSHLYDSQLWCHMFDKLLSDWQIKPSRVKAIIVASDLQLLLTALRLRGFVLIPCLVHTLQQVCMSGCFLLPLVSSVIDKVRMLLSLVYRNSNALTTLRIQEHVLQLEDVPLTLDYPKIWISTYIMFEQLLARRTVIKSIIDAIDASTYEKELINLTDDDWSIVEDVVHVLEPFKVTLMTLAEEKSPLISLLKPLMWQLLSVHLKVREETDSDLSKQLKITLAKCLKEKYSEESVDAILKTATTLDPRFKQLPYAVEEAKVMLNGPIKLELTALMEEKNNELNSKDNEGESTPTKKTRLSGMEFLLGDLCTTSNTLSVTERAELEITQYQSEPTANLVQCPLTWWQKSAGKFPNLALLASSYNCITATATPPYRIPVEPQVAYDMKRSKIFPEIMDKLLFLHANRPQYL